MFDDEWSHGEWFNTSPRLLAFVERAAAGLPLAIDVVDGELRRRKMVSDKKRVKHRRNALKRATGFDIPDHLLKPLKAVPIGQEIPPTLLTAINGFVDDALQADRAA
jgi:hypothetical protein